MATKERFSNKKFCEAWNTHGPQSTEWSDFVAKMRKAAGNPKYSEDELRRRLNKYAVQLKGKAKVPYYPKERAPSALVYFKANPANDKETKEEREHRIKEEAEMYKNRGIVAS